MQRRNDVVVPRPFCRRARIFADTRSSVSIVTVVFCRALAPAVEHDSFRACRAPCGRLRWQGGEHAEHFVRDCTVWLPKPRGSVSVRRRSDASPPLGERLQNEYLAARQKRGVHPQRRVLGRGADQKRCCPFPQTAERHPAAPLLKRWISSTNNSGSPRMACCGPPRSSPHESPPDAACNRAEIDEIRLCARR